MASRNSRSNRSTARSSRAPESARNARAARSAQAHESVNRRDAARFGSASRSESAADRYSDASRYSRTATTNTSSRNLASTRGRDAAAYGRQGSSQYSRSSAAYSSKKKKKMGTGKKVLIGFLVTVLVLVAGAGTAAALYINSINSALTGGKSESALAAISDVLAPSTTFSEPFYMVLIGSDARADDPSSGARSDTNILVRVDPKSNQVTMISIPRDTKIDIDGYGTNKFNAAYNYGGAAAVIREASQLTGASISHYAEVNFDSLIELVDSLGGVDVDVPYLVDDPDADGTTDNPDWEHVVLQPGYQHLTGNQALTFARSRAYTDGDFTRTSNQRLLIQAVVEKVLALPATELPSVIQKAAACVSTDFKVQDIVSLAQQFQDTGNMTIYSAMVPSTTGYVGDVSYVFCDEASLKQMMTVVEEGGDPSDITVSQDAINAAANSSSSSSSSSSSGSGAASGVGSTAYNGTGSSGYSGTSSGTSSGGGYSTSSSGSYY